MNALIASPEARAGLQIRAKGCFAEILSAFGWNKVAFGGEILPRARWAKVTAATLVELSVVNAEQAEVIEVILAGAVGNSSQLGGEFLKEGKIVRESADVAAKSLTVFLAERAAAKAAAAGGAPKA